MIKIILIGGHIYKSSDGGKSFCDEMIRDIKAPVKILDCLFAREQDVWTQRFEEDNSFFSSNIDNFELELAMPGKFIEQINKTDVVFFQGGVPKQLMSILHTTGDWLKALDGKVLVGSSGGADTICKYYGVGKTSNIGEGLGLLPIKFIPHWKSDYVPGLDIDWEQLLNKVKFYKEDLEVVTLKDGDFLVFKI